jgi:transcriptional regulator with XRE-family HTH domain
LKSLRSVPSIENPKVLGEHLRKRRLELGLLQQNIALRLNVSAWTYRNWENGRTTPGAIIYQRIVEFLGYYSHPTPPTLGHRLLKIRRCLGLTSRQAARLAQVDHHTFLMWEGGKWTPTARTRAKVERFLEGFEQGLPPDCPPKDTGSLAMDHSG